SLMCAVQTNCPRMAVSPCISAFKSVSSRIASRGFPRTEQSLPCRITRAVQGRPRIFSPKPDSGWPEPSERKPTNKRAVKLPGSLCLRLRLHRLQPTRKNSEEEEQLL